MTAGREQDAVAAGWKRLYEQERMEHAETTDKLRAALSAAPADPPAGREQDARETLLDAARTLRRTATRCRADRDMRSAMQLESIAAEHEARAAALLPSPPLDAPDAEEVRERIVAALMTRWGCEDDDQDAYDAACADFDLVRALLLPSPPATTGHRKARFWTDGDGEVQVAFDPSVPAASPPATTGAGEDDRSWAAGPFGAYWAESDVQDAEGRPLSTVAAAHRYAGYVRYLRRTLADEVCNVVEARAALAASPPATDGDTAARPHELTPSGGPSPRHAPWCWCGKGGPR